MWGQSIFGAAGCTRAFVESWCRRTRRSRGLCGWDTIFNCRNIANKHREVYWLRFRRQELIHHWRDRNRQRDNFAGFVDAG